MHIEREPGKEMLIDWMGDTLEIVYDAITGQVFKANFFVTTLGYSAFPVWQAG
jgi:transposase